MQTIVQGTFEELPLMSASTERKQMSGPSLHPKFQVIVDWVELSASTVRTASES